MGVQPVCDGAVSDKVCAYGRRAYATRRIMRGWSFLLALGAVLSLSACSQSNSSRFAGVEAAGLRPQARAAVRPAIDPVTGTRPSPRLQAYGAPVRKGGGRYKIGSPYRIAGRWYYPKHQPDYDRVGIASWYGRDFHGRKTANGEIYDLNALTAAHPTLPLPSLVYVTNLANNRTMLVRVNDRGPYAHNRIIDLSRRVAEALDFRGKGITRVRVRYHGPAPLSGDDRLERHYLAAQHWYRPGAGGHAVAQNPARRHKGRQQRSGWWWPATLMSGLGFGG